MIHQAFIAQCDMPQIDTVQSVTDCEPGFY